MDTVYTLNMRQKMLLLLILLFEDKDAYILFKYLPEDEEKLFCSHADKILELPENNRKVYLVRELKHLRMNITGVNITHPEKAARLLADEPHDIVSIIVSRLPSDVCAEVLKYCSQQDVISSMQECKSEIVDVILRRFMHRLQSLKEIDDEC